MGHLFSSPVEIAHEIPQITHVIFDLDGTLIDSEEQYFSLQIACLAKFGKEFTIDDKRALIERTKSEEIDAIIEKYGLRDLVTREEYLKVSVFALIV